MHFLYRDGRINGNIDNAANRMGDEKDDSVPVLVALTFSLKLNYSTIPDSNLEYLNRSQPDAVKGFLILVVYGIVRSYDIFPAFFCPE